MADIGSTSIYLLSTAPILNKKAPTRPIIVRTVVGSTFKNSHECNILVKFIPTEPRTGHILPGLQRHYPVSIAPLWGTGCKVLFTNEDLMVTKIDQLVCKVWHYWKKHFWRLPLLQSTHFANSAYQQSTMAELINFLHVRFFIPVKSTYLAAIKQGFFVSVLGTNQ